MFLLLIGRNYQSFINGGNGLDDSLKSTGNAAQVFLHLTNIVISPIRPAATENGADADGEASLACVV